MTYDDDQYFPSSPMDPSPRWSVWRRQDGQGMLQMWPPLGSPKNWTARKIPICLELTELLLHYTRSLE